MAWYSQLYARSPVLVQNIGISAYGLWWRWHRWGGEFPRLVREFKERESWDATRWQQYVEERLGIILRLAAQAPIYQEWWRERGFDPSQVSHITPETLVKIPPMPKDLLRSRPRDFVPAGSSMRSVHPMQTSGSTGTPLTIFYTPRFHHVKEAAEEARFRNWAGVSYNMPRAMIGGRVIVPVTQKAPPFWRYNLAERQVYLSAFHIAPANVRDYLRALEFGKPRWMTGYASGTYFLARLFAESGIEPPAMQAVLTSSDELTPEMRHVISQVYRCRVWNAWGLLENCGLASECEHGRLHVSPDVGIVEILDAQGNPCPPGVEGEITCTGLHNEHQPLVRYQVGDLAVWDDRPCPCGRAMPVLREFVGRVEDVVTGPDGRKMTRFHGLYYGLPVREGQLVQEEVDRFRIRIVRGREYNEETEREIRRRLVERLGPVQAMFEYPQSIERTERGKFRAVVSKVYR